MALRANDADGYKGWLALDIEKLGRDVAGEVESDWMMPLLVEEERDRLMAWQLGVSPKFFLGIDHRKLSTICGSVFSLLADALAGAASLMTELNGYY